VNRPERARLIELTGCLSALALSPGLLLGPVLAASPAGGPAAPLSVPLTVPSAAVASPAGPAPAPAGAMPARPAPATALSLEAVLREGLAVSAQLRRSARQVSRDAAVSGLSRSLLNPRLNLIGSGSYTQVGTSIGLITGLPTLGDVSVGLDQNGYAVLQNTFGNVGLVLDLNLLPLQQLAQISADQARQQGSEASLRESERQARFELVSTYRQLQLNQALLPVWTAALQASSSLQADVQAFRRNGLAARIDTLRAQALVAGDRQGLSEVQAQLAAQQARLAILLQRPLQPPLSAADPIVEQGPWPADLASTLESALRQRPLLEAFRAQQRAQRQQARVALAGRLPSVGLVAGLGYSGNRLAAPVLQQQTSLQGPIPLALPSTDLNNTLSGAFYNWGAALLLRQPLWDGGRSGREAAVAERQADLIASDEQLARQQISQDVSAAWNALQTAPQAIAAARLSVEAQERALGDARLRFRAQIDPLTEVLLVQRDLQAARASLATVLTRQALDQAVLERETGLVSGAAPRAAGATGSEPASAGDGAGAAAGRSPAQPLRR